MEIKHKLISFVLIINLFSCSGGSESDESIEATLPQITTKIITSIDLSSATSGGNVISNGNATITQKGVCWSTNPNPTISDSRTTEGAGNEEFTSDITGLSSDTEYFVRAYATNSEGTAYGNELSFQTLVPITPAFSVLKVVQNQQIRKMIPTSDGGYLGLVIGTDYEIQKFDAAFNQVWNKTYGGTSNDFADDVIQTSDGGYLIIGRSDSNDGDVTNNYGENDIWACKVDGLGNLEWERSYGGSGFEGLSGSGSVLEDNNNYYFVGFSDSQDGDLTSNKGGYDTWFVKIDASGNIVDQKTFGGSENDFGRKVIKTGTTYTISILSNSSNGDFASDANLVVQLDSEINVVWSNSFSGINTGYLTATNNDEIVTVNCGVNEYYIDKISSAGNITLSQTIDFTPFSDKQIGARQIISLNDGGFFIIGSSGNGDNADAVLLRLDSNFNLLYHKIYAGSALELSSSIIPVGNDEYVYQFFTSSTNIPDITSSLPFSSPIISILEE
ncbi:hypothetical protein ACJD0Z_04180 [Flavobacteriaceae bacterium M23B6Z8]